MEVRPASTVILVRPGCGAGVEVFMLRRSAKSAFAPNVYVFPGGTVDPADRKSGIGDASESERARLFRMPSPPPDDLQIGLLAAARRELFEEAGVLLDEDERLELFSHWITPVTLSPRYDVYFFTARLPKDQEAVADAYETHDGIWIAPSAALARGGEGGFSLIYPTRKHLERIAAFDSVEALLGFAATKPIATVLARGSEADGFTIAAELENAW
ncbi:MAG: NUDIX hydrolase [Candidatus Tyrphobacter sp.]